MNSVSLAGRHAFITGGARGLGLVMARALAGAGAAVTITAGRSAGELAQAHAELSRLTGGRAFAVMADVADPAACAHSVAAAGAALGPVDILVNNAARGPREQPASHDTSLGIDPWALDTGPYAEMLVGNVAGAWFMAREVVPGMVERGFGRVINISTSKPTMEMAIGGAYGPSKAALEAQSRAWARHLEGSGVTVNLLLPGGQTDTDFIAGGRPGERPLIDWPERAGTIEEGRTPGLLPPEVMAAPVVWLASEASAGITGKRWVGANWHPALAPEDAARVAASS
ncbi:SDR family NAD(P)-dependent oxidoreductase [Novosphingobium sp. BL-52-GroH]|uniref:SDR family NAD(P)-dependent oxidoreductase n=1 Tax=Novosphingobium sp. BL-52-GroH TaxID=3349877 RepID=UPI00384ADD8B